MRVFSSMMVAASAIFALAGTASAAGKADMSDTTYLAVAHCAGVAEGTGGDVASFNTVLNAQSGSRSADVMDRADEARSVAKRNVQHAGQDGKAEFLRERDGVCRSYLSQS